MLIDTQKISGVASAGSFSGNTSHIRGLIKHIIVKPANETTTYNISIVNPSGIEIYYRTSETGTLTELTDTPANGIFTASISSATADELFIIELVTQE